MEVVLKAIFLAITKHFSHQYPLIEKIIMIIGGVGIIYLIYQAGKKFFVSSSAVSNINSLSHVDDSSHSHEKPLSNNLLENKLPTKCAAMLSNETVSKSSIDKFCIYCGKQLNISDKFCSKCGNMVKNKQ